jgi:hypothetical protein
VRGAAGGKWSRMRRRCWSVGKGAGARWTLRVTPMFQGPVARLRVRRLCVTGISIVRYRNM